MERQEEYLFYKGECSYVPGFAVEELKDADNFRSMQGYYFSFRKHGFIFMLENLGCCAVRACAKVIVGDDELKVELVGVFCGA